MVRIVFIVLILAVTGCEGAAPATDGIATDEPISFNPPLTASPENGQEVASTTNPPPTPEAEFGRFVVFYSFATNLVPDDTNGVADVFIKDRKTGVLCRVSVDGNGIQGNGDSQFPSLSSDGRFVAFESSATNLVSGDTNARRDIFIYDRETSQVQRIDIGPDKTQGNGEGTYAAISGNGRYVAFLSNSPNGSGSYDSRNHVYVHDRETLKTSLVSVTNSGELENGNSSGAPAISDDGRFVAFHSDSTNLDLSDSNNAHDVFVRDRIEGTTTRVNVDSQGNQAYGNTWNLAISGDGRYVAFESEASNLVAGDTNSAQDVFLHDLQTGETTRISLANNGAQSFGISGNPSVSRDGRYVAFGSAAPDLVSGDGNGAGDVFVRDRVEGTTARVSVATNGVPGNNTSWYCSISSNGRYVAFASSASTLAAGDRAATDDIFVRDRQEGKTEIVSLGAFGTFGDNNSTRPSIR